MSYTFNLPINSLSFGLCSYNLLKEAYSRGVDINLFPIGHTDISCFDRIKPEFVTWIQQAINKAQESYNRTDKEIRLWHISGSDTKHSDNQRFITFFEPNGPSTIELNIVKNQEKTYFTSEYTANIFRIMGCQNIEVCHLGFDSENFYQLNNRPYGPDVTTWLLAGKAEFKRKRTNDVIQSWIKCFANNPKHRLHVHCYNSHLGRTPEEILQNNTSLCNQMLAGRPIWNVNFYNKHFSTLTEYNQLLNSCDIFLDGSGNENWNLPGFHATGLGKHLVTVYANGVKEWANEENAVLVAPGKLMEECYDGMFFHPGTPWNNGFFFSFDEEAFIEGMKKALERSQTNRLNSAGLKLQTDFTWSKTLDKILE